MAYIIKDEKYKVYKHLLSLKFLSLKAFLKKIRKTHIPLENFSYMYVYIYVYIQMQIIHTYINHRVVRYLKKNKLKKKSLNFFVSLLK